MRTKKWTALLLGVILALAVLTGCSGDAAGGPGDTTGGSGDAAGVSGDAAGSSDDAAGISFSSFTADTLDGETFTQDDIKDKDITIVNFWGMFCNPCRAEMPDLAAYAKALPDNVQLITICIDALDDLEGTKEFLASSGYEGVTLLDGDESFEAILYSQILFPTTVFVNSEGEIVGEKIEGRRPDLAEVYTAAVNKVLKEAGKAEISVEV